MSLALAGQSRQMIEHIIPIVSPLFVNLLCVFMIIPIAKYATHRIKQFPFLWITGALILDRLISVVIYVSIFGIKYEAVGITLELGMFVLLLPGATIGYLWARKTHVAYIMARLFKQLSRSDQKALIDLVQTLPGVPTSQ